MASVCSRPAPLACLAIRKPLRFWPRARSDAKTRQGPSFAQQKFFAPCLMRLVLSERCGAKERRRRHAWRRRGRRDREMSKGRPADRGQGSTARCAEELQPDCRRGPVVYDVTATYRVDRMAWQSVLAGEGDAQAAPRAIGALTRGHAVSGRQFTAPHPSALGSRPPCQALLAV